MTECLIALGGNINASEAIFSEALQKLERPGIKIRSLSRTFVTAPVGTKAGGEFLNAAAIVECSLRPQELLAALHEVEHQYGRTRTIHWGPRTLDLDLCLFGSEMINRPELVVPHPAMWYRRFVLDPATEIAPEMRHPILKSTVAQLREAALMRPLRLEICAKGAAQLSHVWNAFSRTLENRTDLEAVDTRECSENSVKRFACVIVEFVDAQAHGDIVLRTSADSGTSRTIRLFVRSSEDANNQLNELLDAIMGDSAVL